MKYLFLFTLLFLSFQAKSQNVVGTEYGFGTGDFFDWDGSVIPGFPLPTLNPKISLSLDGEASNTNPEWGGRSRIESRSGDRAVAITSDFGDTTRFTSPDQDFTGIGDIYVSFHQYYRRGADNAAPSNPTNISVELYDGPNLLRIIPLEEQLVIGVETARYDTVLIHAPELADLANARIALVSEGASYFWLIDDVTFYDSAPYPRSNPPMLSDSLFANGYPFEVGPDEWPFVPNEMIVQYTEALDSLREAELAARVGARIVQQCACGTVAVWEINGSQFLSQGGDPVEAAGGTTDIFTNIMNAQSETEIREAEPNTYNNILLDSIEMTPLPATRLTSNSIMGLKPSNPDAFRIAILDTGLDYTHPDIRDSDYLRIQNEGVSGDNDLNDNCLKDDPIGWNFVDTINNPFDDNGHGTHVAGILIDSLRLRGGENCDYEIIPYKTHDFNGISTLYNVVCGTYQAVIDDVDVINDSWGFYGDPSAILRNAIDSAAFENILVIAAVGNDTINLNQRQSYPACYGADNVISVGSVGPLGTDGPSRYDVAAFSNFSNTYVDVLTPGSKINSTVPNGRYQQKSGTSMSAPMVTAALARMICCLAIDQGQMPRFLEARNTFLDRCDKLELLRPYATSGRFLTYDPICKITVPVAPEAEQPTHRFEIGPNPFSRELQVTTKLALPSGKINLIDANGREVFSNKVQSWQANAPRTLILPELPAGVYFLRISGTNYQWTEKLLRF